MTIAIPAPLREGARRVEVENSGNVVFLYDDSFLAQLRADEAEDKLLEAMSSEKPPAALESFLAGKRVVAYELRQDDPIVVDIAVGPPLSVAERKRRGVDWFKPAETVIALPTGRLRIESLDALRFGNEDPSEQGATIEVPPGEYLVKIHRVDGDGDAIDTITLTPLADAKAPRRFSAALPIVVDKPKHSWIGKYEIEGNRFTAKGCFVDHWEFIDLNLDRAAGETLQLGPGSVLDVDLEGRRIVFVLLGEAIPFTIGAQGNARRIFGHDRTTGQIAKEPEVVMATWRRYDEDTDVEILRGVRVRRTNQPTEKRGKWQKAAGTVRAERLPQPDLADVEKWRRDGDAVTGTALVVMDPLVSVSLAPDALVALGASSGDVVTIEAGGAARSLLIAGSAAEAQAAMQRTAAQPLVGFFDKFWLDPARAVFVVFPLGGKTVAGELPCKPGDDVTLRRR